MELLAIPLVQCIILDDTYVQAFVGRALARHVELHPQGVGRNRKGLKPQRIRSNPTYNAYLALGISSRQRATLH